MSTTATTQTDKHSAAQQSLPRVDNGYGRARLRLGVFGVGMWVAISSAGLASGAAEAIRIQLPPSVIGDVCFIGLFIVAYVLLQLPLDLLGGYRVPKRFERSVTTRRRYMQTLLRGIACHTLLLVIGAAVLYTGGKLAGITGALTASLLWIGLLAVGRGRIAKVVAQLLRAQWLMDNEENNVVRTELIHSADEGFTGGITGFASPVTNILPAVWKDNLKPELFDVTQARRKVIIQSGAWRLGRWAALAFTSTGLFVSLLLAGPDWAGTGVGIVETSLWFTLWSFAGLLVLPTLSRSAVYQIDQRLISDGLDPRQFKKLAAVLDGLQDAEPKRTRWVERIFHPIPSVSNRHIQNSKSRVAFWDIARTSVYLGIGSLSLLTRSVHCNVGRPALWVWLPTE